MRPLSEPDERAERGRFPGGPTPGHRASLFSRRSAEEAPRTRVLHLHPDGRSRVRVGRQEAERRLPNEIVYDLRLLNVVAIRA
jgi:hypothetical protein